MHLEAHFDVALSLLRLFLGSYWSDGEELTGPKKLSGSLMRAAGLLRFHSFELALCVVAREYFSNLGLRHLLSRLGVQLMPFLKVAPKFRREPRAFER